MWIHITISIKGKDWDWRAMDHLCDFHATCFTLKCFTTFLLFEWELIYACGVCRCMLMILSSTPVSRDRWVCVSCALWRAPHAFVFYTTPCTSAFWPQAFPGTAPSRDGCLIYLNVRYVKSHHLWGRTAQYLIIFCFSNCNYSSVVPLETVNL